MEVLQSTMLLGAVKKLLHMGVARQTHINLSHKYKLPLLDIKLIQDVMVTTNDVDAK